MRPFTYCDLTIAINVSGLLFYIMEDILEAVETANTTIALSITPNLDLDGAILSLENIFQRLEHLYPLLFDLEEYSRAIESMRKMINELIVLEEDKQLLLRHEKEDQVFL